MPTIPIKHPCSPRVALLALVGFCSLALSVITHAQPARPLRFSGSMDILMAGNARFVTDRLIHPDQSNARRKEVAGSQKPFAIILTCSDSRVSPEIYFDQGLGDLFVIRNAGNVLNGHVIGSIEYAVDHLNVPLIVVVGHERCGAVGAAVAGGHAQGHIQEIVAAIAPAVAATQGHNGDPVDNAVIAHAQLTAASLRASGPILAAAVEAGKIKIVAARYDLDSGRVELLPDLPESALRTAPKEDEADAAHTHHPGDAHQH